MISKYKFGFIEEYKIQGKICLVKKLTTTIRSLESFIFF